jgi:hypothetical protein
MIWPLVVSHEVVVGFFEAEIGFAEFVSKKTIDGHAAK